MSDEPQRPLHLSLETAEASGVGHGWISGVIAAEREAIDKNFCVHTPLWDWMFGTSSMPRHHPAIQHGLCREVQVRSPDPLVVHTDGEIFFGRT